MSNSTITNSLYSPTLSSSVSHSRPTSSSRISRRQPNETTKSSLLRLFNSRAHNRADSTPRSERRRQLQPAANILLAYYQISQIEYNLSLNPSLILVIYRTGYSKLSTEQLDAPATNPPTRSMSITCRTIPWTIEISSSVTNGSALTVGDVLGGIYRGLRTKATKNEWNGLSSEERKHVRRAWISRYKRQPSLHDQTYEKNQGLRRVDFLCENLAFKGLTPNTAFDVSSEKQQWTMHVGPLKRKVKFRVHD